MRTVYYPGSEYGKAQKRPRNILLVTPANFHREKPRYPAGESLRVGAGAPCSCPQSPPSRAGKRASKDQSGTHGASSKMGAIGSAYVALMRIQSPISGSLLPRRG